MRKISEFSVANPVTVLMLMLAVVLLGYISFDRLGMDLLPDLNNPRIFIEVKAGEHPPEEMEKQFVDDIESVAIRQKKVTNVKSVSQVGMAQITVEYDWDADMDQAFLDLQKSLTSFLQNDEIDELTLTQHDPNSTPVLLISFSHPQIHDMDDLRRVAENYISNELIRLEGIAAVEIIGGQEKEVRLTIDPFLLKSHRLTLAAVAAKIRQSNINASGGSVVEMGKKYIIKGIGEFSSIPDIGKVIISESVETNGKMTPVYLRDIAKIELVNKDAENIVRLDSTRCIALAVYKETKFNTVKAVANLQDALKEIKKALPGYTFEIIENQSSFIEGAINEVEDSALIGILLAVIVLFVFLRRIGTTLIMSVAIPISVIATFNLMYFNGLTLNIMTLGGLALGAGMLVDNAIVVMENIFRNLEEGMPLREAAVTGTAQVGGAITASTITTIVVFLPIVYLHGAAGELFKEQAWTVAFSLLSSLVVAILLIPMLSHRFLKGIKNKNPEGSIHFENYKYWLEKILVKRKWIILSAFLLVICTVILIPYIGSEFIPKAESNSFKMNINLPEGTALRYTDRAVQGIEKIVHEIAGDDLNRLYAQVGPSSGIASDEQSFFEDENTAVIHVFLKKGRRQKSERIIATLNRVIAEFPDIECEIVKDLSSLQSSLGTDQAPVVLEVYGDDLNTLRVLTDQIKSAISDIKDLTAIETSFDEGRPEINLVVDRVQAGVNNLSVQALADQLRDQIQGNVATEWEYNGEMRDILVRYPQTSLKDLTSVPVQTSRRDVPLDELVKITQGMAQKEIQHENQNRVGRISAYVRGRQPFDKTMNAVRASIAKIPFPEGYQFKIGGEEQKREESFHSLQFALLLSIILIYMVLASQFESLLHPFTILLTLPLAGVGAILIFFFLGRPLNIMAYIGIIMLMGIAVNDSIILVDAINQLKWQGMPVKQAIITAGQRRIRPIIMTSLTTILALLPLTIGFGESAALRAPMALAVIGGLISSTVLTLIVIPCVYLLFENIKAGTHD